jgi:CRISPR system Cascade subunit CasA
VREAASAHKVGAPSFSLSGQYSNDPTTEPWQGGIGANLPLDYGGQRKARLGRADVAVLIARHDLAETIWAERMAARAALIDLRLADRAPLLARQAIARRGAGRRLGAGGGGRERRAGTGCGAHRRRQAQRAGRWASRAGRCARRLAATLGCRRSRWQVDFAWEDFADPVPEAPVPDHAMAAAACRPRRCAARRGRL